MEIESAVPSLPPRLKVWGSQTLCLDVVGEEVEFLEKRLEELFDCLVFPSFFLLFPPMIIKTGDEVNSCCLMNIITLYKREKVEVTIDLKLQRVRTCDPNSTLIRSRQR